MPKLFVLTLKSDIDDVYSLVWKGQMMVIVVKEGEYVLCNLESNTSAKSEQSG